MSTSREFVVSSIISFIIYFGLYFITAIPAELYSVGEIHNSFNHFCFQFQHNFFILVYFFFDLGIHRIITPIGSLIFSIVLMSFLTTLIINIICKITKIRANKNKE